MIPLYIYNSLPTSQQRARAPSMKVQESRLNINEVKKNIADKFVDYIKREYIKLVPSTNIKKIIDYFAVTKTMLDIRVVFNGTSCGLNDATWASNFWLPTSLSMTRLLNFGYKVVDIYIGEIFLNFLYMKHYKYT